MHLRAKLRTRVYENVRQRIAKASSASAQCPDGGDGRQQILPGACVKRRDRRHRRGRIATAWGARAHPAELIAFSRGGFLELLYSPLPSCYSDRSPEPQCSSEPLPQ